MKISPISKRLAEIQKNKQERLFKNKDDEERKLVSELDKLNSKLPTLEQLSKIYQNRAHIVLSEIQNQMLTEVCMKQQAKKDPKMNLKNYLTD